jgi:hypothetical protein
MNEKKEGNVINSLKKLEGGTEAKGGKRGGVADGGREGLDGAFAQVQHLQIGQVTQAVYNK